MLVLETPAEFNFKLGEHKARVFGDFAYNFSGDSRAEAAVGATAPDGNLPFAITGQNKAYQVGVGYGNLGLVYGQTSKKNTWEARVYWQHVEQYAADVNLLDSDFFEGRANLQGVYAAFAYSITDAIIGTVRYGYAQSINSRLGTGGNNPDLPILNPINNYNLVQLDLTWRFYDCPLCLLPIRFVPGCWLRRPAAWRFVISRFRNAARSPHDAGVLVRAGSFVRFEADN